MKAIQFDLQLPRYILTKALGRFFPSLHWNSTLSCLRYREADELNLPNENWVKIKVTYSGVCGSDMNLIFLHDSPATSPYASFPFTLGHEIVGEILEKGEKVNHVHIGDRVVVDPVLSCVTRGFETLCSACQRGDYSLCNRMTEGSLAPGLLIGACRDTGGGWSSHVLAHQSQVIPLSTEVSNENGVMVEPFSCALHAIMRNPPKSDDTILVIGAGVIGLCVIAALRALDYTNQIVVLAKHPVQMSLAKELGANSIVQFNRSSYETELTSCLNATILKPILGPSVIHGGADLVIECVGREKSVHDALRFSKSGGRVVLLGLASMLKNIDWTTVWLNELEIKGSFAYSTESYLGQSMRTLEVALDLMKKGKVDLTPLITHRFPLENYKEALRTATQKGNGRTLKILFEPNGGIIDESI